MARLQDSDSINVLSLHLFEIGGLVVTPEARNKGIGRKLVEFACEQVKNQNIALRVRCNAKRQETHEFYERIDFITTKSQLVFEMYLGDD